MANGVETDLRSAVTEALEALLRQSREDADRLAAALAAKDEAAADAALAAHGRLLLHA